MLHLYIGPAGSGKTAAVNGELARLVEARQPGNWLIVPEQYSHEAERELCLRCGDAMSRYAEVFSFTGLARRVLAEQGGAAVPLLDKGGRLLCMSLALTAVGDRLRAYAAARKRAEFPALMLSVLDELKSAGVGAEALRQAAAASGGELGDKLDDVSLVLEAYDAVVSNGRADPADRLSLLAERLPACVKPGQRICVDGFIDFTAQERAILRAMLAAGAELTVCLTLDTLDGGNEIFDLSRRAARSLLACARELGAETELRRFSGMQGRDASLRFLAEHLFSFSPERFGGETRAIRLHEAASLADECEFAAARALELVRGGARWRDIAVAARGFEDYRPVLENAFRHYGVPLYITRRSELLQKPLPALIRGAYEILENGWDVDETVSYLRTGLTGLSAAECDELENYVFKWQIRAPGWTRRGDWKQHPDGYGAEETEQSAQRLQRINALRRRVAAPLLELERLGRASATAAGQAAALARYFEALRLPETLERRAAELLAAGQEGLAAEVRQLWELTVSALEQAEAILGESESDLFSFGRLFCQMLSQYDIGTIPVSLDRVPAGDFDRMRRRRIRHLIVLGAAEGRLPPDREQGGLFSGEERERLLALDVDLGGAGEEELWREFALIYHVFTLPSGTLDLCRPATDAEGEKLRPAFVFSRVKELFSLPAERVDPARCRLAAPAPALTLAANALRGGSPLERAAAACAAQRQPERYERLRAASEMTRGSLSARSVEALYGQRLRLSASRADKFSACRFSYFCQYGLKAKPYEPAAFSPPEVGDFLHAVLEGSFREAQARGGFRSLSDEELRAVARGCIEDYVSRELNDFEEKSARFVHLFRRLCRDAERIVLDTVQELRRSDFEPLDFELDFARARDLPPVELGQGEDSLSLTGRADRVDGWLHGGTLYLRVVDYKTGTKKFSLSDIWYGMGLQMLTYLFSLEAGGERRYGYPVAAAGVMYLPAKREILKADRAPGDAELDEMRARALRRSGLVLDDGALIEAWEKGADKRYIPVSVSSRNPRGGLASAEELGRLARHVKAKLREMARELRRGSIAADPYFRSGNENACQFCDFADACQFSDGEGGEHCRYLKKLNDREVWSMIEEEVRDDG